MLALSATVNERQRIIADNLALGQWQWVPRSRERKPSVGGAPTAIGIAILRRSAQKYRKYVGTVSVIAVYEHDRGTEGSADLRERHRGCRHYLIRRSRF